MTSARENGIASANHASREYVPVDDDVLAEALVDGPPLDRRGRSLLPTGARGRLWLAALAASAVVATAGVAAALRGHSRRVERGTGHDGLRGAPLSAEQGSPPLGGRLHWHAMAPPGSPPPPGAHSRPFAAQEDYMRRYFGVDEATYKELFEQADADGDGKLHPSREMHTLIGLLMQRGNWTPPGFNKSDENGDGQVSGKEFRDAETHWQERFGVNDTECDALLRDADEDGDELLSPSEFKTLLGSLEMVGKRHHNEGPDHHGRNSTGGRNSTHGPLD